MGILNIFKHLNLNLMHLLMCGSFSCTKIIAENSTVTLYQSVVQIRHCILNTIHNYLYQY